MKILKISWIIACLLLIVPGTLWGHSDADMLVDMAGRKVMVPSRADRIVVTFKPATLCVFAPGLHDSLVGVEPLAGRDKFQKVVYSSIVNAVSVGDRAAGLNYETIISLQPDIVILFSQEAGVAMAERLTKVGITSLVIMPESFGMLSETLRLIARAVREPARAEKIIQAMNEDLMPVEARVSSVPLEKRKRVYHGSPLGFFSAASGKMIQGEMLARAGAVNVRHELSGFFQNVSLEQLLEWNPDFFVFPRRIRIFAVKEILERSPLQSVEAIRSGCTFVFPEEMIIWDFPSPFLALGVLWLGKKSTLNSFRT